MPRSTREARDFGLAESRLPAMLLSRVSHTLPGPHALLERSLLCTACTFFGQRDEMVEWSVPDSGPGEQVDLKRRRASCSRAWRTPLQQHLPVNPSNLTQIQTNSLIHSLH